MDDPRESRMEDYLVRYLIERNEIDYDAHADLLYKLAGQTVARLRSYLETDEEVESALLRHGRQLAEFVFAQMMQHYKETPLAEDDYEVRVTRGFSCSGRNRSISLRARRSGTSANRSRRHLKRADRYSAASRSAVTRFKS